ncbi:MAG: hypothetical protein P0Y53_15400 [Candidatus Pseudobacter hemicellulosilyticus]|uniref:Uncharacterized protein n=1 Tax=Candidatus Pseudobacter hemicellulosilyticus TaxID=3121375 RepID=A0AAJ6BFN1_9BACT|nr:MAG: hypothetical protein P0Y53_15400 [Pseudobacter sp.]
MKTLFVAFLTSCLPIAATCQYLYNDLIMTGENIKKRALYQQQGVKAIRFNSQDGMGQPIDGFSSSQTIKANFTEISTLTSTSLSGASTNSSFFNAQGQLVRTIDTSDGNKTTIEYSYYPDKKLQKLTSVSSSPGNFINKEAHYWTYQDGKPVKMLRIRNDRDTTFISFILDEAGNIAEEHSLFNGQEQPTYYYYYDEQHRLTDIVRYNQRAKRMLPDYIFEYTDKGQLATMLVTTEGTSDYQKWQYTYNEKDLKVKDECFAKSRALIGQVLYQYNF